MFCKQLSTTSFLFLSYCLNINCYVCSQMPYYHKNGLVISNIWKCIMRYITGSLLLDIIINTGLPASFYQFLNNFHIDMTSTVLVTISISFAQLYILIGIFDYLSDTTRVNFALITVSIVFWACSVKTSTSDKKSYIRRNIHV